MTNDTPPQAEFVKAIRRHEVQAMGAAISLRSWHDMERAYNQLRDKIDRWQTEQRLAAAPPQAIERSAGEDERRLSEARDQLASALNLRGSGVPAGRWGWAMDHGVWLLKLADEAFASRETAALATRSTMVGRKREQIARILSPKAFSETFSVRVAESWGEQHAVEHQGHLRMKALAKADAILAVIATPVTGDAVVEQVAEALWQDDYRRSMGRDRLVPWSEANEDDANQKRSYARAAIRSLTNSTDKGGGE